MSSRFVITGIDTDAGKTVVSALLCAALEAAYWKPVQAGVEPSTDALSVAKMAELAPELILPEAFRLKMPASPHAAAAAEGIHISLDDLQVPEWDGPLVIEGAGGLMVPINEDELFLDLFRQWQLPVILVARTYLGSINHTLLSAEVLRQHGVPVMGLIFNEGGRPESEAVILRKTGLPSLGKVPQLEAINRESLLRVWEEAFDHSLFS